MSFKVQCSENYYGPNCTTHCEPVEGVYTCDGEGRLICLQGNQSFCTLCISSWNPSPSCAACLDPSTRCTTCHSKFLDPLTYCTECVLRGYDPALNCTTCHSRNLDLSTNCTTCNAGHFLDPQTDCTECVLHGYDPSSNCTTCLPVESNCSRTVEGTDHTGEDPKSII